MDAAEIAAEIAILREDTEGWLIRTPHRDRVIALLDAIEQAQKDAKERDGVISDMSRRIDAWTALVQEREQQLRESQKDAKDARALAYEECAKVADDLAINPITGEGTELDVWTCDSIAVAIRARIEAMLEQKI